MRYTKGTITALMALAASATVLAQVGTNFTITDAETVFVQGQSPTVATSSGPTSDFRVNGPAGTDHGFQNWWWFRVDGVDTRENAFFNATGPTVVVGNTATTNWAFSMFTASLVTSVNDTGTNTGDVNMQLTVTNTSTAGPISLNLFNYLDLDVNNATVNNATLLSPTSMNVAAGGWSLNYNGFGANAWQVTPFATLRGLLTNTAVNNLTNTGLPLTGDFTGAYQWMLQLNTGQSAVINAQVQVVPEPATFAVLAIGGLGLLLRRRKK